MTKYEDLIKQREKKSISLETIFRKYKMTVNDVKHIHEEIENVKKEADRLMIDKITKYEKEISELKSKVHVADTETALIKATGMNSPEMQAAKQKIEELQKEIDRIKKENNECYNRIADLTESLKSKDYFRDPDYKYLVDENHRLEQEKNELLVVNRRLNQEAEEKLDRARKAGL